jgi:hypothetical protein
MADRIDREVKVRKTANLVVRTMNAWTEQCYASKLC